jgi:DNA-binding CsgD family transcriptional regulator/tetratricopeptide (TPR) repeat protein
LVGRCAPPPSRPLRALTEIAVTAVRAGADLAATDETVFGAAIRTLLGEPLSDELAHAPVMIGEGLRALLTSGTGPVLCVVEDLHWADDETLAALDYLVDHIGSDPIALVCTARLHEASATDAVLARWDTRGVTRLTLNPLGADDVARLVSYLAPTDVGDEFIAAVATASEGHPLLVEEFAREARPPGEEQSIILSMPMTYLDTVRRRVQTLPREQRARVQLAAMAGRTLETDVLDRLGVADAHALIDDAVRVHLVAPATADQPARFRHDLTRDAVVLTLSEADRRRIASTGLEALEVHELDDRELEVASQLAAAAGDTRRATELLIEAARRAVAMGATTTALARLDAAGALADADVLHGVVIREHRVEALALAGRATEAIELGGHLVSELSARNDTIALGRVQLALARASGSLGRWRDAAERLDGAFPATHRAPTPVVSYRAICAIELGDVDHARELAERALRRKATGGVPECEAHEVLGRVAREANYVRAADHFRAGVEAAVASGLQLWRARSLLELGLCEATVYGRSAIFEAASRSARRCGALALSAMCDYNLANLYGIHLRGPDALATSERAIENASRVGSPILEALGWVTNGQAQAVLGDRGRAALAADRAVAVAPTEIEIAGLAAGMCGGFANLIVGDIGAAVGDYARSLDVLCAIPVPTATSPWYFGPIVLAVADHPGAEAARAQIASPSFAAVPTLEALAPLVDAIVAGRTDGPSAAERHLALVHESLARYDEIARTVGGTWHLIWATVAPAAIRGRWGTPIEDLRRAERWFSEHGFGPTARWCSNMLRDAGVGPRRRGKGKQRVPEGLEPYGLTAREVDVLQLLGERLTNKEIATRLVVSPSTVKTHVERLLSKTGRANRLELAELAEVALR